MGRERAVTPHRGAGQAWRSLLFGSVRLRLLSRTELVWGEETPPYSGPWWQRHRKVAETKVKDVEKQL